MLLQFSVENYLSFKNKVTFSMISTSITEHEDTHVFEYEQFRFLKSAVLYGANASGKSNLFSAMQQMKYLMINSSKESQSTEEIDVHAFRLSTQTEHKPSLFEIVFIQDDILYRYGFVVDRQRVHEEWLYHRPDLNKSKEKALFIRNEDHIVVHSKTTFVDEGKGLERKTRSNALFISVVANFNGMTAMKILEWMRQLDFLSGTNNSSFGYTLGLLDNPVYKKRILRFIRAADLDIEDLQLEKVNLDRLKFDVELPKDVMEKLASAEILISFRQKFNEHNEPVGLSPFDVVDSESEGTKKFLSLAGPILEKFEEGGIIAIDELDAKLHPLLTRRIIEMFHSYDTNKKNAQLIFATHDVTNLNKDTFRRDQVWFAEKDRYGSTELYSLAEYKLDKEEKEDRKVRKDASYGKDYLLGKYGGIPNIGSLDLFLRESSHGD